ncbi:uncharacterized protein SCHCODRAFT_02629227 [Schizophyllum commune H4-8]|nr:uncharacterized protein SCHCODRAFT_02629227 [Schizophyllum commune H4-8]KAI5891480.1 hypothetical protein SCHCODRAFT_02629227 [Schizophyllum commune H4-8]
MSTTSKQNCDALKQLPKPIPGMTSVVECPHVLSSSASPISGSIVTSAQSAHIHGPARSSAAKAFEDSLSSNAASIDRPESIEPSTKERPHKIAIARVASEHQAAKTSAVTPLVSEDAKASAPAIQSLSRLPPSSSSSSHAPAASESLRPSPPSTSALSHVSSASTRSSNSSMTRAADPIRWLPICINLTIFLVAFFATHYALHSISQPRPQPTQTITAAGPVAQGQPAASGPAPAPTTWHAQRPAGGKAAAPVVGQAQSAKGQLLTRKTAVGVVSVGPDGRARRRIRFVRPPEALSKVARKRAVM